MKNIVTKELKNELMLYDTKSDHLHILDTTGRLIYKMLHEGKSVDEIETAIRDKFQVSDGQNIRNDILNFAQQLQAKGLMETRK